MDVVLEIGKRDIRIGVVEERDPIIIPISYKHTGESNYLSDHSLTKDQYQSIISQLDETNQIKLQQYNESLGTWIDIELISPMILQKLLFDVIDSIPVNIKRCFLIDYGFSQKLKTNICTSLFKYRVKSVIFIPAPLLYAIGSNRRDALIVNEEWNTIHKVIDLRIIGEFDIDEPIDSIILKSDIDIRKPLRENIVNTKDGVGCWTACSLYVASTKNANWEEITKDYISQ